MLKKIVKTILGTLLVVMALSVLGYFIGFLSGLFKAIDLSISNIESFHPPPTDIQSAVYALTDWKYTQIALAVVGIIILIVLIIIIKNKIASRNYDDRNFTVSEKGTYGTATYMNEKEAKRITTADGEHCLLNICKKLGDEDGVILGRLKNDKIVVKKSVPKENMNIFVCGAPGSGKSYMFVRPYLAQCIRRNESFVCTDPSGELLETMGGYAKECGYKVKVFNLVDPSKSDSWNVTGEVGTDQLLAQICVSTIIRNTLEGGRPDPFWDNGEKNLLKALLLYINSDAYTGNKSLGELYSLLTSENFITNTLECLKNLPESHPAKLSYNIYAQATESVQASYASGLATRLQIFQSEDIRNMTAFNDIDLTAPGKEKCAYFIVMSDQDSTYQLLSSLFFSFIFIKLADYGKTCQGQSLPVRVNVVLDELPSVGNIPDLGRKLATVRKYGVNVIPIIQLISQLDNRYSPAERDEIIGCCDTQIWLGSNDLTSADVLSKRSGTMTVDVSSKSEKLDFITDTHLTSSVGKRPVLTVDEVLRLPLDEAIIVLRGQNIMKVRKYSFNAHPDFAKVKKAEPITISEYRPEFSDYYGQSDDENCSMTVCKKNETDFYEPQPKPKRKPKSTIKSETETPNGNNSPSESPAQSPPQRRKSAGLKIH